MDVRNVIEAPKYSIVMPVYNSEQMLEDVCLSVNAVFNKLRLAYEIILVNDGSRDNSWQVMKKLNAADPKIKILKLTRNFSEHNAVIAGLKYVRGDFAIVMDDDGQNPPEEIPKLIDEINKGYDVVFANYKVKKHSFFRNLGSAFNDRVATILLKKPRGLYLCSFKIFSRVLINEIIKYRGPYPYIDGLIFRSTMNIGTVQVEHRRRLRGESGYTFRKLVSLWLNMFTNFSVLPLRISMLIGLFFALVGFILAIIFLIDKIFHPTAPTGWATIVISIFMFSGIQLIILGVIGEYLGRLFLSSNQTPQFIIQEQRGFNDNIKS
ncbi:MAG: undecaprenyl-phosphate 4-deoxy-4-formamido-L-arabinose transferase [Candidatus Saganbacteria bacterium]|uniref:Undecaprenyl-phosphate 4-deoxy-4-formamido-L-arabinose transferase n=1 Tax=Candidatus Saganbacteria bacterium TaxID=2575572 RepID=A0A833P0K6_UNCSA|nr:MAG: undecaprenyl-phosphate 4-deoxy-4-formamido-L-arabinose transferase [Candidatus Saganbacteria bacterium]